MTILTELRDPRISDVTVTAVEVSADMRQAKVHVSIMGDENKQRLALRGLEHASGFLQQKVAPRDTDPVSAVAGRRDRGGPRGGAGGVPGGGGGVGGGGVGGTRRREGVLLPGDPQGGRPDG